MSTVPLTVEDRRLSDRRQVINGNGDLHQRIDQKRASIETERRKAARRQHDGDGPLKERDAEEEFPEASSRTSDEVAERLRMLREHGIT